MGVGNGSFKKQMIYRLGYRTSWGNTSLSLFLSGFFKILFFSAFRFIALQILSMKLEPCNSTQGAVFHSTINIKLYLYLGSCSSLGGIIVQTKTFNCFKLLNCLDYFLFVEIIKLITKLSQWNLSHTQSYKKFCLRLM